MAWDKGFNFRDSAGYVTDGTNESPVLGETYPHTYGNGADAGWDTAPTLQDTSTSVDRRLAGANYVHAGVTQTFRVDLPSAGTYTIDLAYGPGPFGLNLNGQQVVLKDSTTTKVTLGPQTILSGFVRDATNALLSNADWPTLKATTTIEFATTVLNVDLVGAADDNSMLRHVFVSQVAADGGNALITLFGTT